MTCPNCEGEMRTGLLKMRKPLMEFLSFGLGTRNVYFKPDNGSEQNLVLHWSQMTQAYQCLECKLIAFPEAK